MVVSACASGVFVAAQTRQLRAHIQVEERVVNRREINAEEVLDNWSDLESDESDFSGDESENEREESSDQEDDDSRQSWRDVPGL